MNEGIINSTGANGGGSFPIGAIIAFGGAEVPVGWSICDGTNGTPDLRNKFIMGAEGAAKLNATGGASSADVSHNHTFSGTTSAGREVRENTSVLNSTGSSLNGHNHTYSGTTSTNSKSISTIPPYVALYYIMYTG